VDRGHGIVLAFAKLMADATESVSEQQRSNIGGGSTSGHGRERLKLGSELGWRTGGENNRRQQEWRQASHEKRTK
jgi:hypothetical protein